RSAGLSTDIQLTRFSALADNDVWGVGFRGSDRLFDSNREGLILHWDGTNWQAQHLLPAGWPLDYFTDIAVTPDGEGWAVGWRVEGSQVPLLYYRYGGIWQHA